MIPQKPFGECLMERGYISQAQLCEALDLQSQFRGILLGQVLVRMKRLSLSDLDRAMGLQCRLQADFGEDQFRRIGDLLVEEGFIAHSDLLEALAEQKRLRGSRIGEVLMEMGALTVVELDEVVAAQLHDHNECVP